jgi:hypothetical protein
MTKRLFYAMVMLSIQCFSQTTLKDSVEVKSEKPIKQVDIIDIYHKIIRKNKNDSISQENKKYYWAFIPAAGYTMQTGFAGVVSANVGFKNGIGENQKFSNINSALTYTQYKQLLFPFYFNYYSNDNKWNVISDNKFMHYPSEIYGLGGKRISNDENSNSAFDINYRYLKAHESVLYNVFNDLYIGGGIYYDQYWDIDYQSELNKKINRLLSRDLGKSERAVGPSFRILYDNRKNQINPNNGVYLGATFRTNNQWMGSLTNWHSLQVDVRKYFKFPNNSENVFAIWGLGWFSSGQVPYLMLPSTSWDDQYNTGRGFVQSRFRGRDMWYLENEYRFKITRNGLLGGVVFGNVQTFSGDVSKDFTKASIGYGAGIRLKFNKHTNTNLCIDYGFGNNDSHGFFVNLGEVF